PLLFYIGREFTAGHDPVKIAQFNAVWQQAGARRTFRIMTVVWGVGGGGGVLAKGGGGLGLSIPPGLLVGPTVSNGAAIGLIPWTIRYARRSRQRANLLRTTSTAEAQMR